MILSKIVASLFGEISIKINVRSDKSKILFIKNKTLLLNLNGGEEATRVVQYRPAFRESRHFSLCLKYWFYFSILAQAFSSNSSGQKNSTRKSGCYFLAERKRLERSMPCGTPHFQCGSLPLEYLSIMVISLFLFLTELCYYSETFCKNQVVNQKYLNFYKFTEQYV